MDSQHMCSCPRTPQLPSWKGLQTSVAPGLPAPTPSESIYSVPTYALSSNGKNAFTGDEWIIFLDLSTKLGESEDYSIIFIE